MKKGERVKVEGQILVKGKTYSINSEGTMMQNTVKSNKYAIVQLDNVDGVKNVILKIPTRKIKKLNGDT